MTGKDEVGAEDIVAVLLFFFALGITIPIMVLLGTAEILNRTIRRIFRRKV